MTTLECMGRPVRGLIAAALLLAAGAATAVAQQEVGVTQVLPNGKKLQYSRSADAEDRALAHMNINDLEVFTYNLGDMGTYAIGAGWRPVRFPSPSGGKDAAHYSASMLVSIPPGPWHETAQVHISDGRWNGSNTMDWDAPDGAAGTQWAHPPATFEGVPLMAHSDIPDTWPGGEWPAPEDAEGVWYGTELWKKWERRADQEAYSEFSDWHADSNPHSSVLGLQVKKRLLAYASMDVVFWQFEMANGGSYDLEGLFVGWQADLGGPVWDHSVGVPHWDPTRQMMYVVGANYNAAAGTHEGEGGHEAPWFGYLHLESPTGSFKTDDTGTHVDDPTTVLTRLALLDFNKRIATDEEKLFGATTGDLTYLTVSEARDIWATDSGTYDNPVWVQTEADFLDRYGPLDPYCYASSGPFDLGPGDSIDFVMAMVAGSTEMAMLEDADKAIASYQERFSASGPPPAPVVGADGTVAGPAGIAYDSRVHNYPIIYAGPGSVTLHWEGGVAENAIDAISKNRDFQGYRIYRSTNRGSSWGDPITDTEGTRIGWVPIAQFDLDDDVVGPDPHLSGRYLGSDTGLVHMFTDSDVMDGLEYWYAVTSYDHDPPTPSLESPIPSDPKSPGMVAVITGSRPNGWSNGGVLDGTDLLPGRELQAVSGPSYGTVRISVIDHANLPDAEYRITFSDSARYGAEPVVANTVGVSLTNTTTGEVLYECLLPRNGHFGDDLLPVMEGVKLYVDDRFNDVDPYDRLSYDFEDTVWEPYSGYEALYGTDWFMSPSISVYDLHDAVEVFCSIEVRFDSTETQFAYVYNRTGGYYYRDYREVPFTVWDVTSEPERQINVSYTVQSTKTDLSYDVDDDPLGVNRHYTAFLASDYSGDATPDTTYTTGSMSDWTLGDIMIGTIAGISDGNDIGDMNGHTIRFEYERPIAIDAAYEFTTAASSVQAAEVDLDAIQVVPNPYYVLAEWDLNENRRKIQFRNVPSNSTVDIYTLAGELVASLTHNEGYNSGTIGTVEWNIWTYEFTEAAYGLYIYVVKTADGQKKVGKFAIIR